MKPDLAPIPFVLTQAEKSKAAWARVAIENHVRETNRRDQQKADAMLRGNNARLGVVERQG